MNVEHVAGQMYYGTMVKPEFLATLFKERLTKRELNLLINIYDYMDADSQGGLPGHNLMVLVSKLMGIMQVERDVVEMGLDTYHNENVAKNSGEGSGNQTEDDSVSHEEEYLWGNPNYKSPTDVDDAAYDFVKILQEIMMQYAE